MLNSKIVRLLAGLTALVAVSLLWTSRPQAQGGLTISFGSFNSSAWPAGPDYATDVLGDPWDFSNVEDLGLDPTETIGWNGFSVTSGLAGGTTSTNDPQMSLLYAGRYGIINPGKTGRRFPIDPSRFQKLAIRLNDSVGGDSPQVYWFHHPWADPADPNSARGAIEFGVRLLPRSARGWQTYVVDLTQTPSGGTPWTGGTGVVRALRLDPAASAGHAVQFDWVRLTPNDNAAGSAMQTISWSGGTGRIDVHDAANSTLVLTASASASSGFRWNYGVLPPGTYTMRVTAGSSSGSRQFTIKAPAIIELTEPNETGGEDFASTVLGNPWDMDAPGDVQITGSDNYTPIPANFAGGQLTATNTNGDVNITLNNSGSSIDTSKYRFLTYRMQVDGAYDPGAGSMTRLFWTSQQFLNGNTSTTTKDIIAWPGMNSYTIDLSALSTAADGGLEPNGAPEAWTSGAKRHLRLDPHEFPTPRTFHVDSVKVAAMAQAVNGGFMIRWTSVNPNGGSPTVALYYDNDTNASNGKAQIAGNLPLSAAQYSWSTGGVPAGDYYIYAETNDGVQTYGRYSTGKVRIGGASGGSTNPVMSIDGPANNSTVSQPFLTGGWAVDLGAGGGSGVDAVHVWAFPVVNGAVDAAHGVFVAQGQGGGSRPDVGAVFGSQFTNSGFTFVVQGLAPGVYELGVYAHSAVANSFNNVKFVRITIPGAGASNPAMAIDGPVNGQSLGRQFTVGGWAIDTGSASGTGVDAIHVWAFPVGGGSPIFAGQGTYGGGRPDIGAAFGSRFTNSGYNLVVTALQPGTYDLVVYAHSGVSGSFNQSRTVRVTVN